MFLAAGYMISAITTASEQVPLGVTLLQSTLWNVCAIVMLFWE
jgi:hypothetical protein